MRNLTELMVNCMRELDSINIHYSKNISSITVNNRLSRALGRCMRNGGTFRIEIAGKTAADTTDIGFLKNVIVHELIHTITGCFNHGYKFQYYANEVNQKLGYHVTTSSSAEDMEAAGITPIGYQTAKYALVCKKCGKTVAYRQRWCDLTANPGNYRHGGCGGDLYTISLDPKVAIAAYR